MGGTVTRRPEVNRDLLEQADFIARQNLDAALRFLDSAEQTFRFLAESPDVGNPCNFSSPLAAGLLRWRIRGFEKHLIFYRITEEGIDVVRVLHGARDWETIFEGQPDRE